MKHESIHLPERWDAEPGTFIATDDCPRWFPAVMLLVVLFYGLLFVALITYFR